MIGNIVDRRPFEDCLKKVKYTNKVPSQNFKESGRFPIVSQEEAFISGYWDNPEDVFHIDGPVVIFGDHSRHVKYVDFDFVIGADGVKILAPVDDINAKFLYYYLKSQRIQSLGYSRHYKVLKEKFVPVPSLADQQHIVAELDLLSGIVEKKNAQLNTLEKLAESLFIETFGNLIANDHNWRMGTLNELIEDKKRIFRATRISRCLLRLWRIARITILLAITTSRRRWGFCTWLTIMFRLEKSSGLGETAILGARGIGT